MDESNSSAPSKKDEPQISDLIDITIKTIDSKNFSFQVENDIQIKAFKEKIASQVDIESDNQRMIFCGRVLSDDKTLKDYNIDNGKTIHLVKRAPPPQRNNNNNNNANQQPNDSNRASNRRFHSYRSDDGSVFMGTISMDSSSNFINQMVRQMFSGNRNTSASTGENNNSESSSDASNANNPNSLRNRITHIRRFLGFINTNFHILENPNQFPTQNVITGPVEEQVYAAEYITLFNEATSYSERLRPHLTNFFQSISSQPSEAEIRTIQSNHSILMRISHHLSHVMHLLTEFNIDFTSANMPLVLNTLDSPASHSFDSTSGNTTTTNVTSSGMTARIEISTSPASVSGLTRNFAPTTTSSGGSSISFNPSPIVLMEVDTNINLPPNIMSNFRNIGNLITPDFLNSLTSNSPLSQSNFSLNNTTNPSTTSANSTSINNSTTTSTATLNTVTTTSTTNTAPTATTTVTSNSEDSSTNNNNNPRSGTSTTPTINITNNAPANLPFVFDPFLNCNSTYTIPEVRSATNYGGINIMQQMVNSLGDLGANISVEGGINPNNPLYASLNDLFRNADNSTSQSSDEFEFFDLIRFLLNQINLNTEDLPDELNNEPRIGDYLRSLNLVNENGQSITSDLFSLLFQNLGFEDLLHLINHQFHDFNRLRQPIQDFIRTQLLHDRDSSIENIRSEISNFITTNQESLITIIANISPNQGVDSIQSFQNFIRETLTNFINMIMQSSSDEGFENDLLAALRYLVSSYIHFCRACFADSESMAQLITNYFEQYANYLNSRIQQFISGFITDRVRSFSTSLENNNDQISQVQQYIVRTDANRPPTTTAAETATMHMETSEPDRQSISNDSEVEFSDAISEFPSTSSTTQKVPAEKEPEQNWQSIVPTEWVPIITEDINKQKNIDSTHQPPFSDAYLNGMPKKRRLEQRADEEDMQEDNSYLPEPKLRSKPQ